MAPAGGIREELKADLEAAEAEFARRLKVGGALVCVWGGGHLWPPFVTRSHHARPFSLSQDGEDFDTLMNDAEMQRLDREKAGGGSGKVRRRWCWVEDVGVGMGCGGGGAALAGWWADGEEAGAVLTVWVLRESC
jgi:hypothetical protein